MSTELEFRGFDRESETMVYSSERGLGWFFELIDDDRIALNDVQPLVCLDKNGDKVYVGDRVRTAFRGTVSLEPVMTVMFGGKPNRRLCFGSEIELIKESKE